MKKRKRIFALAGAALLLLMYVSTFIFAVLDLPQTPSLLMASVACTIILPVLLYGYMLVYRLTRKDDESDTKSSD